MRETSDFVRDARASMFGQTGTCVGATLLLGLTFTVLLGTSVVADGVYGEDSLTALTCEIVVEILLNLLWVGFCASCLGLAKDNSFSVPKIFTGFSSFGRFIKILVLVILENIFLTLWTLLLVVPGVIKWYAYSMDYFVRLDNPDFGTLETITESRRLMDGNKFRLFKLQCRFAGWFLLCCVTCGLAALWVLPYYYTAKAHFYLEIKAEKDEEGSAWVSE